MLKLCLINGFDFSLNICDVLATLREIVCVKTALCLYLMPEKSTSASTFRLSMLIILISAALVPNAVAVHPGEDTTLSCASTVMDLATIAGEIARTYRHQPSSQNHTKKKQIVVEVVDDSDIDEFEAELERQEFQQCAQNTPGDFQEIIAKKPRSRNALIGNQTNQDKKPSNFTNLDSPAKNTRSQAATTPTTLPYKDPSFLDSPSQHTRSKELTTTAIPTSSSIPKAFTPALLPNTSEAQSDESDVLIITSLEEGMILQTESLEKVRDALIVEMPNWMCLGECCEI